MGRESLNIYCHTFLGNDFCSIFHSCDIFLIDALFNMILFQTKGSLEAFVPLLPLKVPKTSQPESPLKPSRAQTFTDNLSLAAASKDTNVRNNGFETMKVTDVTSSSTFTKSIGSIFSTINKSVSSAFSSLISVPDAAAQTDLIDCAQQLTEIGVGQASPAHPPSTTPTCHLAQSTSAPSQPTVMQPIATTSSSSCSLSQVPQHPRPPSPSRMPCSPVPLKDMAPVAAEKTKQDDRGSLMASRNQPTNANNRGRILIML